MLNIEEVKEIENATHIYVPKGCSGLVIEGIQGENFYKLNDDNRTVIDDDGQKNYAWNMTDYTLLKVIEAI